MQRLYNDILSAVGTPPDRAMASLRAFVEQDQKGYFLTHQLAALEWAKQVGQPIPKDLLAMKPHFLERISQELDNETEFSDLYAEQTAFLVAFGDPSPEQLERAITKIVESQVEPGKWKTPETDLIYDGQYGKLESNPQRWRHCSKLSMVALAGYLQSIERLAAEPEKAVRWPSTLGWVLLALLVVGALFLLRRRFSQ